MSVAARPDASERERRRAFVEDLEARLGDPMDESNPLSFARAVERDELDEYPDAECRLLDSLGLQEHYVPISDGGRLERLPDLADIFRAIARRDLTLAIAHHKSLLGAVHVWTAGSPAQRREVAAYIRAGGRMALAYHEETHGSDLLATETTAFAEGDGLVLRGEKWLVNNATRGDLHTVFARTTAKGGPRGFSVVLVDKRRLAPGTFAHTPRLKTLGARGADFSGIRYLDAPVPSDCIVGKLGEGLELSLRSFQVTRALVPALSLGALDSALRIALGFALDRRVYGSTVFALPRAQGALVDAFTDLLVCECVVTGTTRALHHAPHEMRLWSAIAKAFVPATVARSLRALAEVLGARSYLREGLASGVFQKIVRDHDVVPLFHAGGFLLLQTVGLGLPQVSAFARSGAVAERTAHAEAVRRALSLGETLPAFEPSALRPYAKVRGLTALLDVARVEHAPGLDANVRATLVAQVRALAIAIAADDATFASLAPKLDANAPELFELSERHSVAHAAILCLLLWLDNRAQLGEHAASGHWLVVSLARLLARLGVGSEVPPSIHHVTRDQMVALHRDHRAFALDPWALAGG